MLFVRHRTLSVLSLFAVIVPLCGCLFRTHPVARHTPNQPLKTATQAQLINYINTQAEKIRTMQATVDIDTSVGGEKKGKVTDYQEIRGYVLVRKPAMLRMIGLMPLVRTRAFDMVSDGNQFKLWIPPKNRFIEGRNNVPTPNSQQPLENLRPQQIYNAMLLPAIGRDDIAVMDSGHEQVLDPKGRSYEQPDYEIEVIRKSSSGDGSYVLAHKIIFSRADLLPDRQIVYDDMGEPVTDARYEGYKDYDGIKFPSRIEIKRPQEEYDIVMGIVKLQLNQDIADDQFQLQQPAGAQVLRLDQPQSSRVSQP